MVKVVGADRGKNEKVVQLFHRWTTVDPLSLSRRNAIVIAAAGGLNAVGIVAVGGVNPAGVVAVGGRRAFGVVALRGRSRRSS